MMDSLEKEWILSENELSKREISKVEPWKVILME